MGRWVTQDPLGFSPGDLNLYRYVGNNPVSLRDPFGSRSESLGDAKKECKCKAVKITFQPGDKKFKVGTYKTGGGWKVGNQIKVDWDCEGDVVVCSFKQDEDGFSQFASKVATGWRWGECRKGEAGNKAAQHYTDPLGKEVGLLTGKFRLIVKVKITFRCIDTPTHQMTHSENVTGWVEFTIDKEGAEPKITDQGTKVNETKCHEKGEITK